MRQMLVGLMLLCLLSGCSITITWPLFQWQGTGPSPSPPPGVPRFTDHTVFVHCRQEASGPYTLICNVTPEHGCPNEGGVSYCGFTSFVCEVRWKFLQTTPLGDIYEFTLRLPATRGTDSQVVTMSVFYDGQEVVIFQDDFQKVGMTPTPTPATMPPPPGSGFTTYRWSSHRVPHGE